VSDSNEKSGCVSPAAGPIASSESDIGPAAPETDHQEEERMQVTIGKEAPDFEASAFVDGGFKNVKLSDYRGKWVFLCFYPGDFTFV